MQQNTQLLRLLRTRTPTQVSRMDIYIYRVYMELMMRGEGDQVSGDTHTHTQSDIKQIKKDENVLAARQDLI